MPGPKPDTLARFQELHRSGLSAPQIAEAIHVSDRTVVRWRRALGLSAPGAVRFTPEEVSRALLLFEDGASCREVARTLGRSAKVIARRFPGLGWTPQQAGSLGATVIRVHRLAAVQSMSRTALTGGGS